MTLQETKELITYIASSFPRFYRGMSKSTFERQAIVWTDLLGEYSYQAAQAGVKAYITADISGFPPVPGQIIESIHRGASPENEMSGTEAWALVRKAVNVPWEKMQESYDTLPEAVRKAVGSAASLKELGMMDIATFESVAASNFMRTYKVAQERISSEQRTSQSAIAAREQIKAELEARKLARQLETGKAEVIPFPLAKTPEELPERETVSEDAIDKGMRRLREKLGV